MAEIVKDLKGLQILFRIKPGLDVVEISDAADVLFDSPPVRLYSPFKRSPVDRFIPMPEL